MGDGFIAETPGKAEQRQATTPLPRQLLRRRERFLGAHEVAQPPADVPHLGVARCRVAKVETVELMAGQPRLALGRMPVAAQLQQVGPVDRQIPGHMANGWCSDQRWVASVHSAAVRTSPRDSQALISEQ